MKAKAKFSSIHENLHQLNHLPLQEISEQQASQLSGGIRRLQEEFQAELATASTGKIRGTLLLSV